MWRTRGEWFWGDGFCGDGFWGARGKEGEGGERLDSSFWSVGLCAGGYVGGSGMGAGFGSEVGVLVKRWGRGEEEVRKRGWRTGMVREIGSG